jgi:hypothetical protein
MCFQYIIKPIVANWLQRRNGNPGNPDARIKEMHQIITTRDTKHRPVIFGDELKGELVDSIDKLTESIEGLREDLNHESHTR